MKAVRAIACIAVSACALSASVARGAAGDYPQKPVRLVVPAAPGGGLDIMGRLMAQDLYSQWHQTVVADNRPGAGVMIGTELVSKAPPDGYTALVVNANLASNAILQNKLDVVKHLSGVGLVATLPNALSVAPVLPAHTMKEFIAYAKAKPLTFGTAGIGVLGHLCGEMLKLSTGIDMVHVPYKGGGPVMAALAAGEVNVGIVSLASSVPHMKSGRVRILGVTGLKRSPSAPDIPAIAETVPGFDMDGWIGFLMPAGTPRPVIAAFNAALQKSIAREDMRQKLASQGFDAQGGTPQAFDALIRNDVTKYTKIITKAHISASR